MRQIGTVSSRDCEIWAENTEMCMQICAEKLSKYLYSKYVLESRNMQWYSFKNPKNLRKMAWRLSKIHLRKKCQNSGKYFGKNAKIL